MGLGFSQDGQVEQLYSFRKLGGEQGNFEIPERPENRRPTDKKYLIAFITVIVVLIPFLVYTLLYSNLNFLYGYDNCGNFCGQKNKKYDEWSCTGEDYTDRPNVISTGYEVVNHFVVRQRECVESCPEGYIPIFRRCKRLEGHTRSIDGDNKKELSTEDISHVFAQIGHDIATGWWAIALSAVASCLLCFGTMCLFRYAVSFVVWFILLGSVGIIGIIAALFWYSYLQYKNGPRIIESSPRYSRQNPAAGLLAMAVIFSIIFIILLIFITCMVKRVKLIIQLFKEATKAIFDVPSMILVPVYTSILVSLLFVIFIFLTFFMSMAGKLTPISDAYLEYMKNGIMSIAIVYNVFVYIWMSEFILGSQYLVIAGAVSAWFFTRNKQNLSQPLWTSFTNFTRFHMGTVAIGSLIITIMAIIRGLIRGLINNEKTRWIIECCLSGVEELLKALSKNAYIQTAMHGQPFFKSGKRAARLLLSNIVNVVAINSVGDFVLGVALLLLIIVSGIVAVLIAKVTGVEHYWALAVISIIIATCMATTYFSIFQATIDSIFICFCEDMTLNDGMARPYFMSKGLMQFVENSKALMPAKK